MAQDPLMLKDPYNTKAAWAEYNKTKAPQSSNTMQIGLATNSQNDNAHDSHSQSKKKNKGRSGAGEVEPKGKGKGKEKGKGKGKEREEVDRTKYTDEGLNAYVYPWEFKKALLEAYGPMTFALHAGGEVEGYDVSHDEGIGKGLPRDQQCVPHDDLPAELMIEAKEQQSWKVILDKLVKAYAHEPGALPPTLAATEALLPVQDRRLFLDSVEDGVEEGDKARAESAAGPPDDNGGGEETPEALEEHKRVAWPRHYNKLKLILVKDWDPFDCPYEVWRFAAEGNIPRDASMPGAARGVPEAWLSYIEGGEGQVPSSLRSSGRWPPLWTSQSLTLVVGLDRWRSRS